MITDRPDDLGPIEPGLDELIRVLRASATPDELAGAGAALEMFRASQRRAPAPARRHRGRWLAGVAALALAGGLAASAYAVALPAAVQHAAYHMLGFAGVPDVHRPARPRSRSRLPAPATRLSTLPARGVPGRPVSSAPSPSPSPPPAPRSSPPAPVPAARLSLAVARHWVAADSSDSLVAVLTDRQGHGVPGRLILLERAAGQTAWHAAGHATATSSGRAVLAIRGLVTDTAFRVTGPDGTRSRPIRVITVPPVSVTVTRGPRPRADTLTVSSQFAEPGDLVVLQVRANGLWRSLRQRRLGQSRQAVFRVKIRAIRRIYRTVLLTTESHGPAHSSPVVIPPGHLSS